MEFLGFVRPNDEAGIRNVVLIVPSSRLLNIAAYRITQYVYGTKTVPTGGENGRHKKDRERLSRLLVGLARNANVYGTIVLGARRDFGYSEVEPYTLAEQMSHSGKPVAVLTVEEAGGLDRLVEQGIGIARQFVHDASLVKRESVPISKLAIGIKCGLSDATSGISGNPTFGKAADLLVAAGGTAIFSETVEIIGAELDLAARCVEKSDAQRLLEMVRQVEEAAIRTGEDIRTINPLPSNIAAGISTLEEKSLGAVQKAGTMPIQGVLEYAQRPVKKGLHFMDGWQSSYSLPMSLAAAGCQLTIYQLGGGDLPSNDPPMLATNTGVVAPLMMITGNPRTASKAEKSIDFSSGSIITGQSTIEQLGTQLFEKFVSVASGELTKGETILYMDPLEPYFLGPVF
ncbi:UxaA family hydrolase [Alicyclobacillus tolerans]|uniref:UxaA family hydrolase n=1 Tax=Alicyclobacillus tolerans TaxID=90970 RepID=UPI001F25F556|nr:UxaA family hydrolase [Alicyclobacillus tolerans]MCF8565578.1 UxaA family hydrolase [Alicyclobacillus tolerans]